METDSLCIIGAGTMGTGIAQVAAQAGLRVSLMDRSDEALAAGRDRLQRSLASAVERGKLTAEDAAAVPARITWQLFSEPLPQSDWVIEAVFEDIDVKREVLQRLAALIPDGRPVSTNTSTIRIADLAAFYSRPERFLGLHFFNPVPAMKLVEVIPSEKTLPSITEAAVRLCERLGKTPLIAPDVPGFIVNRAFAALVAAAIDLWVAGTAPETIDQAIELGLGHKLGPLKSADLVGLDVMLAILESLHAQTGDPRFAPRPEFIALVESGKLGRKTGEGFYRYET